MRARRAYRADDIPMMFTVSEPWSAHAWWPCKDHPADKAQVSAGGHGAGGPVGRRQRDARRRCGRRARLAALRLARALPPAHLPGFRGRLAVRSLDRGLPAPDRRSGASGVPRARARRPGRARALRRHLRDDGTADGTTWPLPVRRREVRSGRSDQGRRDGAHDRHQPRAVHADGRPPLRERGHPRTGSPVVRRQPDAGALGRHLAQRGVRHLRRGSLDRAHRGRAGVRRILLQIGPGRHPDRFAGAGTLSDPSPILPNTLVYDKGAWVLHMLRQVVGDDAFFLFLRDYARTPSWPSAA